MSYSGDDAVSVISYRKENEITRIPVGDHPQRMRIGKVRAGLLGTKKPAKAKKRLAKRRAKAKQRKRARVRARSRARTPRG